MVNFQSLNVVESPYLRNLILVLRNDLKDSDIPHRDTLRARILESVDEYWEKLSAEMNVCFVIDISMLANSGQAAEGDLSFTEDIWTDNRQRSFLAITGHWIEAKLVQTETGTKRELVLRSALVGFVRLPGSHTGEHIAEAFVSVMDKLGILHKVEFNRNILASTN